MSETVAAKVAELEAKLKKAEHWFSSYQSVNRKYSKMEQRATAAERERDRLRGELEFRKSEYEKLHAELEALKVSREAWQGIVVPEIQERAKAEVAAERDQWKVLATQCVHEWRNGTADALNAVCRCFDAMTSSPASGPLVPWTAETRPRGVVMLRPKEHRVDEYIIGAWLSDGVLENGEFRLTWANLLEHREWSRDGITWEACGTRQGVSDAS